MNWKHLLWIIPLCLLIGGFVVFKCIDWFVNTLDDTIKTMDKCSMRTLEYTATHNADCQILIAGYLNNCTKKGGGA